ncbi:MAG: HAD-IB family hydrolase [Fibromonadaceae bacterium]|jgi:HAD superfamily hydrolase (TIGR01490 family)|nr:HAD-IB family hydrolase [Fibromonadaceae bacterium]
MKKETIAAFDFDGTITRKDTLIEFIKFSKGNVKFYFAFLFFSPLLIAMKLKLLPNWKVKQSVFSYLFKNTPIEIFNKWCFEFCAIIDKILCPKTIEALNLHKKHNDKIIVISASMENWIKPWADKMEIDTVLATKIETDENGLITGKFLTKNCYGQEKVNRLLEMFPNRKDYKLIAYGDSRGDKELIEFADKGFYCGVLLPFIDKINEEE